MELLDAEAEVVGILEGVLLAGFGASAVVPRLPRHDGGDARHPSGFARVGHGIDRFRCGRGEHQVDTVAVDQVIERLIHRRDLRHRDVLASNELVALPLERFLRTRSIENGEALRLDVLEVTVEQSV